MSHLKGKGWLHESMSLNSKAGHLVTAERYSIDGSMTFPSLSTGFMIVNTDRIDAVVSQIVERVMWLPGHARGLYTPPHIPVGLQMDSDGLQVDFCCSSTIFSNLFFGGNPAKFQPRVHLESRPTIWTAWTPSHYTVKQPDYIWSPARVYNCCLFILVIIRQGKKCYDPELNTRSLGHQ